MPLATQQVYGTVTVDGEVFRPVVGDSSQSGRSGSASAASGGRKKLGIEYITDRYNTSAKLSVPVLADSAPVEGQDVQLIIQDETVFTGQINSSESGLGDRIYLTAYDAADELKGATLTQSFDRATITAIAKAALEEAGIDSYEVNLPSERSSPDFDNERCDRVLQRCATWGDAIWYVTPDNMVVLTQSVSSEGHDLEYLTDTSDGLASPAYESVTVIGSAPTSRRGQQSMHMLSSKRIIASAGDGLPKYRYEDAGIRTQKMAENAAQSILKELQRQKEGGTITVLGDPTIRPWDTVTLPPAQGGTTYLVSGAEHSLTSRKGFKTKITVGQVVT